MYTDSVNKDTEGEKPSMMKFYLEPKVHKVEIAFESLGPSYNQHARVKIARILVKGTEKGGAVENANDSIAVQIEDEDVSRSLINQSNGFF
jgi:hypothetical protein